MLLSMKLAGGLTTRYSKNNNNLIIRKKYSTSGSKADLDPTTPPSLSFSGEKIDPLHGSYHWNFERGLSVATLGLITAAAVYPHTLVNFGLGVVLPLHCHVGFGAIITDYLPKRKFPLINGVAVGGLYAATALTIYGLYLYNTEDAGIIDGVKLLWRAKDKKVREHAE